MWQMYSNKVKMLIVALLKVQYVIVFIVKLFYKVLAISI